LLYRRQLCLETSATENAPPIHESSALLNSWPKGLKTGKLPTPSELPNTSSKITSESSTTSSDSGTGLNSPSGTKPASTKSRRKPELLESWEHSILNLHHNQSRDRRILEIKSKFLEN